MLKGTQIEVKVAELLDAVLSHIDPKELDFYVPGKDWVIVEPVVDPLAEAIVPQLETEDDDK